MHDFNFDDDDDEDAELFDGTRCPLDIWHVAAREGNVQLIETLLKDDPYIRKCINIQIRPLGCTPLHLAAKGGHVEVLRSLLKYRAEVDKTDIKCQTPLYTAINNLNVECARALLLANAKPDGDDGNLSTPLYVATQSGFLEGVLLLLKYGADPEPYRKDHFNYTGGSYPLQTSVVYRWLDCFKALLAAGAEPDPRKLKTMVPDAVVKMLSLIHCIARHKYHLDIRIYSQLFILFGGYLWQRNNENELVTDLDMSIQDRVAIHELMSIDTFWNNIP